ncbi:hypothetical protein PMAYCL1PPCAC_11166, partial [Pristionchus mayeri]
QGLEQLGEVWMAKSIEFSNFKITNNQDTTQQEKVLVQTLHKYVPVIYIYEILTNGYLAPHHGLMQPRGETLSLAEFVTVTAYQNDAIKKLKVEHNPFAKGCRGAAATSQQQQQSESQELQQQQRRKRSYSPPVSVRIRKPKFGSGPPSVKMASPAFPHSSMMPAAAGSPAYGMPTVPQPATVPPPTNPFPSPPQETRSSPSSV